MIKLNLGSGVRLRAGFINVDNFFTLEEVKSKQGRFINAVVERGAKFVKADIKKMPFPDNYADYVELMEVIEHFPMWHVGEYLAEIKRVMKPGAKLVIMTNSMTGLCLDWLQMMLYGQQGGFNLKNFYNVAETIYGNQYADSEGEFHRCPITPDFLNYLFSMTKFKRWELWMIPKGAPFTKKIGTLKIEKNKVARNDILVAEVIK